MVLQRLILSFMCLLHSLKQHLMTQENILSRSSRILGCFHDAFIFSFHQDSSTNDSLSKLSLLQHQIVSLTSLLQSYFFPPSTMAKI